MNAVTHNLNVCAQVCEHKVCCVFVLSLGSFTFHLTDRHKAWSSPHPSLCVVFGVPLIHILETDIVMPIAFYDSNFCIIVLLKRFLQLSGCDRSGTLLVIRMTVLYPVFMISFVVPNPLGCQEIVGGFGD